MSFEIKTQENPDGTTTEIIEETITKTHQTRKLWTKKQLEEKVVKLTKQIDEAQSRKTELQAQLARFRK